MNSSNLMTAITTFNGLALIFFAGYFIIHENESPEGPVTHPTQWPDPVSVECGNCISGADRHKKAMLELSCMRTHGVAHKPYCHRLACDASCNPIEL